jgi:hypothetical protein
MADDSEAQQQPGEFVIGREMAAALEAEERRVRSGASGMSVMPSGTYDQWLGQLGLYDPEEVPLDLALRDFVRGYRRLGADERESVRHSVSFDEAYTLLAFARRSAVFALRAAGVEAVADGLAACAAIEVERTDYRDVLVAIALLHHSAVRTGSETGRLLTDTGKTGEPALRELIDGFLARSAAEQDLRDAWGWVEIEAPGGTGLLAWGFRPWMPSLDLVGPAMAIATVIDADAYRAADVTLATEIPEVWLADAADPGLGSLIGAARGTITIQGRMRPAASPDHDSQQLTIFLLEATDADAAMRLVEMAKHGRPDTALLGVAAGPLFALVVARSWVEGVASFEDTDSLARFRAPLRVVLKEFAQPR